MGAVIPDDEPVPCTAHMRNKRVVSYVHARLGTRVPDRSGQLIIHVAPDVTLFNVYTSVAAVASHP